MYKSPIELFELDLTNSMVEKAMKDVQKQREEHIIQVIKQCGVNVDKDELIKALQYDRKQYNEGYYDGYRDFANKLYSAFREHYSMYKDDALVKMSTVVELIREVKDEIYVNTNY